MGNSGSAGRIFCLYNMHLMPVACYVGTAQSELALLDLFKKKSTALLGVDISSSSIKLLELSRQGDKKFRVERYFSRPLPEGAVVEKNISNLEAVGEEILKLSTLAKTGASMVACSVKRSPRPFRRPRCLETCPMWAISSNVPKSQRARPSC